MSAKVASLTGDPEDELQRTISEASDYDPGGNHAMSLRAFLAVDRPPLKFLINDVLPERGKLTIAAPAKYHKTMLIEEMGICLSSGHVEYLGMRFNEPVRVLMEQPELSDALMEARTNWIMSTIPEEVQIDLERVADNFHIMPTEHGRPCLWRDHSRCAKSRNELERAIEKHEIKVILADSLYMLMAGMDENAAEDMTVALDYFGNLTVKYGVAIILTHHFNKSGTASRGSSVYQGWGETDLALSPEPKDPEVVRVDALMRCAFPAGYPAFWYKPTRDTAWFCPTEDGYTPPSGNRGRPKKVSGLIVADALKIHNAPVRYTDLLAITQKFADCASSVAKTAISDAVSDGLIVKQDRLYILASNQRKS